MSRVWYSSIIRRFFSQALKIKKRERAQKIKLIYEFYAFKGKKEWKPNMNVSFQLLGRMHVADVYCARARLPRAIDFWPDSALSLGIP